MSEELDKVRAAAASGLTKTEVSALLGRTLSQEEATEFDKTKALVKLKAKQEAAAKKPLATLPIASVGITNKLQPKLPPLDQRYTKEQLEECIERQYGIVTAICNELDCTYSQFYKAVKHLGLQDKLSAAKKNIVSMAEQVILGALASPDEKTRIDAAKYTLSRVGKDQGWGDTPFAAVQVEVSPTEKAAQIRAVFGIPPKISDQEGQDNDK